MRRLDFLVPHYLEQPEVVLPLLDSIKSQRAVDLSQVGVIIAFDGPDSTPLPIDEWRETYPFAIEDVHPDKGGVSTTRNAALDASGAEYVMFSDFDDCLMDNRGLYIVFREMDAMAPERELVAHGIPRERWEPGFDYLMCDFVEETKAPDGGMAYVSHSNNQTFVHSQVARRQWLVDNGIRFIDHISVHEDHCWVQLCLSLLGPCRGRHCSHPWYLWCWNPDSVCRHDPLYIQRTYGSMIRSSSELIDQLVRRSLPERAADHVAQMVFDGFYTMAKQAWLDVENREYRDDAERDFARFFRRWRHLWDDMPPQRKAMISQGVRQRSVMDGMLMEALTCEQWISQILLKYPE